MMRFFIWKYLGEKLSTLMLMIVVLDKNFKNMIKRENKKT
jgi:hypothetical protein